MTTTHEAPIFGELLDLLAEGADPQRVLGFRLSEKHQSRLDALLEKNRVGALSQAESDELDEFERYEHMVRLLKARVARAQTSP